MVAKAKTQAAPAAASTTAASKKNAGSVAAAVKSVLTEKQLSAPKPAPESKQALKTAQVKRKTPTDAAKPVVAKKEIPMRVEKEQVVAAANALQAFVKKQQEAAVGGLFDEDPYFFIMIALQRFPAKSKTKPIRIPIPHTLFGREGVDICLITKDPQSDYESKLENEPVEGIKRVLGVSTLRSDYKQYKDRLQLLSEFDLFLADERVLPLLPALLGSKFFEKKKHPAAVNLTKKSLAHELCNARDATYLHLTGPSLMIKIAKSSFSRQHIVDNIMTAIPRIIEHVPRKWKNIQAIYLRTHDSVALPLYNAIPSSKPAKAEAAAAEPKAIESTSAEKKAPAAKKTAAVAKADGADEKKADVPKAAGKRARAAEDADTKAAPPTNGASPAKKVKSKAPAAAEAPVDIKAAATPKPKAAAPAATKKKPATKAR